MSGGLWRRASDLLGMIRFSHTVFALPFALLAAVMAWKANSRAVPPVAFRGLDLLGILVCMVFVRSAAMAFNRLVDRDVDAENPRTRTRHLPSGALSVPAVAVFTVICGLGFVGGTLLFLPRNPWPLTAAVPVLAFLLGYSYAKRFTMAAHFWLGAALMLAPVAAWVAIRAELAWPPVVLGLAVMLWVAGFDVIYACQDAAFDVRRRLQSVPARWGVPAALKIAAACHLGTVVLLAALPWTGSGLGAIYLAGVAGIALLLFYEHWLVRPDDLSRVNQAFFHVNAVISIGLLIVGSLDLWVS